LTSITYPPGPISQWGMNQALQNQLAWISYIGTDGSIFYLAGPAAPMAGAQDGLVLRKHMGLMAPFELLELKGARQDGATWTDTVYEPAEIMLTLEASSTSSQGIRNVIRQWISAWDPAVGNPGHPTQLGVISVHTPDLGEWWAPVRLSKNISDVFDKDYTYSFKQAFTWACKNYSSFWYGPDSTSVFNSNTVQYVVVNKDPVGSFTLANGSNVSSAIHAFDAPNLVKTALETALGIGNILVNDLRRTFNHVTYELQFVGSLAAQQIAPLVKDVTNLAHGFVDVIARPLRLFSPLGGGVTQVGFVPLTNIGDLPAWPRYLCYGPGTFAFGNGPGSSSYITLGPLNPGQIVLVTTEPRYRSVVDLTPGQPGSSGAIGTLLSQLISFATNNNVPPLLQRFESFFGVIPPQGNLYSLMSGRFTNPVPGTPYGVLPQVQSIPVWISNGNANSQIIASLTPMRRWPL